jgi:hypothetical protein
LSVLFVLWPHSSQTYTTSSRSWEKRTGIAWTGRIPVLQRGQSGLAKTMLELTPAGDSTRFCIGSFSPICIELKRPPDLRSADARSGRSRVGVRETQRMRRKRRAERGCYQHSRKQPPVWIQSLVPADGVMLPRRHAANLRARRARSIAVFWQLTQRKPPAGTHLTWRVQSQAQEQLRN